MNWKLHSEDIFRAESRIIPAEKINFDLCNINPNAYAMQCQWALEESESDLRAALDLLSQDLNGGIDEVKLKIFLSKFKK